MAKRVAKATVRLSAWELAAIEAALHIASKAATIESASLKALLEKISNATPK